MEWKIHKIPVAPSHRCIALPLSILHAWLISAYSECVSHPERRFALGFLLILCVCAWGRDVMVCVCLYSVIQHDSPALEIPALC